MQNILKRNQARTFVVASAFPLFLKKKTASNEGVIFRLGTDQAFEPSRQHQIIVIETCEISAPRFSYRAIACGWSAEGLFVTKSADAVIFGAELVNDCLGSAIRGAGII